MQPRTGTSRQMLGQNAAARVPWSEISAGGLRSASNWAASGLLHLAIRDFSCHARSATTESSSMDIPETLPLSTNVRLQ